MFYYQLIASHPADRPALTGPGRAHLVEMREQVDRWAAFLQEAGLRRGQGLFSRNCAEYGGL